MKLKTKFKRRIKYAVRDKNGVEVVEGEVVAEVAVRQPYALPYLSLDDYVVCIAPIPGFTSNWVCADREREVVVAAEDLVSVLAWYYGGENLGRVEINRDSVVVEGREISAVL